jgi:hypothetical protein
VAFDIPSKESQRESSSSQALPLRGEVDQFEADSDEGVVADEKNAVDETGSLSFAELVELWHHQDDVASHKERMYVPLSLSIFALAILGWDKTTPVVVFVAGAASSLVHYYHLRLLEYFAERQRRLWLAMEKLKPGFIGLMADDTVQRYKDGGGKPLGRVTQVGMRRPVFTVLVIAWIALFGIKLWERL